MTTTHVTENPKQDTNEDQLEQIDQLLVGLGISERGTVTGRISSAEPVQGNRPKSDSIDKQE